jgi:hypothetical protein
MAPHKRRIAGGFLAFIGFILSPLSWWNDLFVNVPLAIAFGWLVALVYRPAFVYAAVLGYWLTNVLGFVLIQKGARMTVSKEPPPPYDRRALMRDLLFSLLYTLLIVLLLRTGLIAAPDDLLKR